MYTKPLTPYHQHWILLLLCLILYLTFSSLTHIESPLFPTPLCHQFVIGEKSIIMNHKILCLWNTYRKFKIKKLLEDCSMDFVNFFFFVQKSACYPIYCFQWYFSCSNSKVVCETKSALLSLEKVKSPNLETTVEFYLKLTFKMKRKKRNEHNPNENLPMIL